MTSTPEHFRAATLRERAQSLESAAPIQPIELAVVIPTYNERDNVSILLDALEKTLVGTTWEAIFVDDNSPDGTADYVRDIALVDRRVRVLERVGRRGLSSACIEGMLATAAPYVAVMDGDLQHDEHVLPEMLKRMKSEGSDVVVASRNVAGGSMGEFSRQRAWLSRLGTRIGQLVCHCEVHDAMSGFFLVDRKYFQSVVHRLTGTGFKILVDLLASSSGPVRISEVPYHFRTRQRGESKLDVNVELEYLYLLIDKVVGGVVPTRFILFILVGSLGVLVHLAVLGILYTRIHSSFVVSQAAATLVAMTFNFVLNNIVTFRDRHLRGWRFMTGLLTFYLACSLGALINVGFARFLLQAHLSWYAAGIAGISISSVWNYGVNTILTWRRGRVR